MKINIDILSSLLACKANQHNFKQRWETISHTQKVLLAENTATPTNILQLLSREDSLLIKETIVQNQSSTNDILARLARDQSPSVRLCVAENKNTTNFTLFCLAKDSFTSIRRAVAENKNTTADILEFLAKDKYEEVKVAAIKNKNITEATINILAQETPYIRRIIAENTTYVDVLQTLTLTHDLNAYVRKAAKEKIDAINLSIQTTTRELHNE